MYTEKLCSFCDWPIGELAFAETKEPGNENYQVWHRNGSGCCYEQHLDQILAEEKEEERLRRNKLYGLAQAA
jgi:hypothetical protein